MSEDPRKPLRARMREAHEQGKKLDISPDEVTGVIDVANAIGREAAEKGREAVEALIKRLDSSVPPPKPKTA